MDPIWCHDGISIRNLHLLHAQSASLDAWSRPKPQPISVSLHLSLSAPFTTAARADALDTSTLHYGHLSKTLSSLPRAAQWESLDDLASRLASLVRTTTVAHTTLILHLLKGSLLGQGVEYTLDIPSDGEVKRTLHIPRLALPVLVGLNPHERTRRQPLLVSIWLIGLPASASDAANEVERVVEEAIRESVFETLEALILDLVQALEDGYVAKRTPEATLRVRVEKPLAVSWADAPAVEVVRTKSERTSQAISTRKDGHGLRTYRPYL